MATADLTADRRRCPVDLCRYLRKGETGQISRPYYSWTNEQAGKMNRTIKDATIKASHFPALPCWMLTSLC